jgi:hypothetical protein
MSRFHLTVLLVAAATRTVAATFIACQIPSIEVGPVNPLSGAVTPNYRQTDINGDGRTDLVLPTHVVLGTDTAFDTDHPIALPWIDEQPQADLWKDRIYLLTPERWRVVRRYGDAWVDEVEHPRTDFDAGAEAGATRLAQPPGVRWTRFLYDFDVDGQPEVALVRPDGLHVLRVAREGLSTLAVLNVLPPMTLARVPDQVLWPTEMRRLAYPSQQLDCRILIDNASLMVITREPLSNGHVRYRSVPYRIDISLGAAFVEERGIHVTPPLPDYMQPCRLNKDESVDFAGGDWEFSSTRVLPVPLHTAAATTDGGQTIHTMRSQSYSPQCVFVDFDGDERLDLVAESSGLFRGGLRESLNRYTSERTISHEIAVYPQSIGGGFSVSPTIKASFAIELLRAPFQQGEMLRRYQASELFNVTGDFNGDGRNDFAVRDTINHVALYLSTNEGRSDSVYAGLTVDAASWRFRVADVNLDGRSDLLVESSTESGVSTVVHLMQGVAP